LTYIYIVKKNEKKKQIKSKLNKMKSLPGKMARVKSKKNWSKYIYILYTVIQLACYIWCW